MTLCIISSLWRTGNDIALHCKICSFRLPKLSEKMTEEGNYHSCFPLIHTAQQWNRWRGINVSQFHWFGDRCQSKCCRWRLWWWWNAELTCFIMLPHYLEWRTPASFDKWTSRFTTASFESKSIILSPTWKKTMIKTGTLSTLEDLLFCLARNWP